MAIDETLARTHHSATWTSVRSDTSYSSTTSKSSTSSYSIDDVEATSPWYAKNVLSLDGGGTRCLASLLILEALMKHISFVESNFALLREKGSLPEKVFLSSQNEILDVKELPCHYFDYIGGTSTGGLIAIMLGRLRMTVKKTKEQFLMMTSRMFGQSGRRTLLRQASKVRRSTMTTCVQQIHASNPSPGEIHNRFQSDIMRCRTVVFTMKGNKEQGGNKTVHMFRSYEDCEEDSDAILIDDVAQASVATTSHFESFSIGEETFLDASTCLSNPTEYMLQEVCSQHMQYGRKANPVHVLLSIGCSSINYSATQAVDKQATGARHVPSRTERCMSELASRSHERVNDLVNWLDGTKYFRFDPLDGLETVASHDWRSKTDGNSTVAIIQQSVYRYLDTTVIQDELRSCAFSLVRHRRLRESTDRWLGFAWGTKYRCNYKHEECSKAQSGTLFADRDELMDHLFMNHRMPPPDESEVEDFQQFLDECRVGLG